MTLYQASVFLNDMHEADPAHVVGQVRTLVVAHYVYPDVAAAVSRVLAEANRLSDTAALFVALGGGWPTTCQTSLWRECVLEGRAPAAETR